MVELSAHKFNCFFEPLISSSATILNAFALPALCSSSVSFPAFQNCDEWISWIWKLIKNEAEWPCSVTVNCSFFQTATVTFPFFSFSLHKCWREKGPWLQTSNSNPQQIAKQCFPLQKRWLHLSCGSTLSVSAALHPSTQEAISVSSPGLQQKGKEDLVL